MENKNKKILLKVENASFYLNNKALIKEVSLEIKQGEIVTLIGPNGSGKSTTAKIALGVYKKIEGRVRRFTERIGYVPQKISVDWTLPIRVIDFMSLTEDLKNDQINVALNLTGVEHLKNKSLSNLSDIILINSYKAISPLKSTPCTGSSNTKSSGFFAMALAINTL